MIESYKKTLAKYSDFSGRASRYEYWMFVLTNFIIVMGFTMLTAITSPQTFSNTDAWKNQPTTIAQSFVAIIYGVYLLFIIVPSLAVTVRRLHDSGKSGLWLLITLISIIPCLGIIPAIVLFVFYILDSQPGTNQYGPNPKGIEVTPQTATPVNVTQVPPNVVSNDSSSEPTKGETVTI